MTSAQTRWQISGDYFENCNCDVACPCFFSSAPPLTAQPTQGACEVAMAFHIDQGSYDGISLDDLNVALAFRTPGPMGEGNWSAAVYLDERANEQQRAALQTIFTGQVGGPLSLFAPLISTVLGVKPVPISYHKEGTHRSAEIPGAMALGVHPIPSVTNQEVWAVNAHPFNPQGVAMAAGNEQSTWEDYGMRWDNSGKNGHYAAITWSNA